MNKVVAEKDKVIEELRNKEASLIAERERDQGRNSFSIKICDPSKAQKILQLEHHICFQVE